ncbi:MAG: division/cell wall cluster transcriptional repressor MraZ [Christensenellaceae bacterium]|nr:division/cell wall cluster transcriptional repressor MraZ [Christensenellaceae bacterium]
MLFGEYNQQIDEKGRVRIPAKLKAQLCEEVTITKGTNGCLFMFPSKIWHETLATRLSACPISDLAIQRSLRAFFSSASILEEDNQGRCLMPRNLRDFANIKKDIVFIGVGNRVELWARENYDAYMSGKVQNSTMDYDKLFAELGKYNV